MGGCVGFRAAELETRVISRGDHASEARGRVRGRAPVLRGAVYRPGVDEVTRALADQLDELRTLVADLDEGGLRAASACPGWSISDVLLHLAQTNEIATASAMGSFAEATEMWRGAAGDDVDALAGSAVERDRGASGDQIRQRWQSSADAMVAAFAGGDPARRVMWVVGDMAARTLATTRIAETWIHAGDIAAGMGVVLPPTDRLRHVARLVHRTLPYAFARAGQDGPGAVRFDLTASDGGRWEFGDDDAPTVVTGSAVDLCRVAGQRAAAANVDLRAEGPDAAGVLELMRTFA